ncbi:MAG: hypothetical protein HYX61_05295 [Gammaproteobacteria bacterium]|jgi:hypothetical protein|nr:hypothetical protein [Gammaproteobacteria bacterium]
MSDASQKTKNKDDTTDQAQGLTLHAIWDSHHKSTVTLSKISRQLAFASVAVCWLFRQKDSTILLHGPVLWALIFALIYFLFDLLQYISAAYIYYAIANNKENELNSNGKKLALNEPCYKDKEDDKFPYLFLKLKVCSIFISYILLFYYYINMLLGCTNQ